MQMYETVIDKADFIMYELEFLVRKIDNNIEFLFCKLTDNCRDVGMVEVHYKNKNVIKVNVECDSLSAIAIDVIKAIQ